MLFVLVEKFVNLYERGGLNNAAYDPAYFDKKY